MDCQVTFFPRSRADMEKLAALMRPFGEDTYEREMMNVMGGGAAQKAFEADVVDAAIGMDTKLVEELGSIPYFFVGVDPGGLRGRSETTITSACFVRTLRHLPDTGYELLVNNHCVVRFPCPSTASSVLRGGVSQARNCVGKAHDPDAVAGVDKGLGVGIVGAAECVECVLEGRQKVVQVAARRGARPKHGVDLARVCKKEIATGVREVETPKGHGARPRLIRGQSGVAMEGEKFEGVEPRVAPKGGQTDHVNVRREKDRFLGTVGRVNGAAVKGAKERPERGRWPVREEAVDAPVCLVPVLDHGEGGGGEQQDSNDDDDDE